MSGKTEQHFVNEKKRNYHPKPNINRFNDFLYENTLAPGYASHSCHYRPIANKR
jgi:hypothetical protein